MSISFSIKKSKYYPINICKYEKLAYINSSLALILAIDKDLE